MKIIVTGAAGFIGSNLCEELIKEHQIIGIDNFDPFYSRELKEMNLSKLNGNSSFQLHEGDITDAKFIDKVFSGGAEMVIHLAAKAGVRPSLEDPLGYTHANIDGTMCILEGMKKHGIANMAFASSSSVYGNNKEVPFKESDFVDHPISPYAATKKACELLCHTYAHLFNLNIAALRFFTVYGRRQRPDLAIAKFTRYIDNDIEIPFYGDGSTERDYTYIDDIIDGIKKAMSWISKQGRGTYDVFNLGESHTTTLRELVETIEKALGKEANKKLLPLQPGDVKRTFADVSKAKSAFGYDPKTLIPEGIQKYVMYYRDELSGNRELISSLLPG